MVTYCYDSANGRYLGAEVADPDPLKPGHFLFPANSTTEMPPTVTGSMWPHYDPTRAKWFVADLGNEQKAREMRTLRNAALYSSDWTQLPDVQFDETRRKLWAEYRQALRDLTKNIGWPNIGLPAKPEQ